MPSDLIPVLESRVGRGKLRVSSTWRTYAEVTAMNKGASGSTIDGGVLASLFAAVGKHRTNHIPWEELNSTDLADAIYALAECICRPMTTSFSRGLD